MATAVKQKTYKDSTVFWQECEDGVPEQAILFEYYEGTLSIQQGAHTILLNYDTLNEFKKLLVKHETKK